MTERRNRLSEMLGDTLARLTTDSGVASVVAYIQEYERLVLGERIGPERLVPAESDVQAIFRLIQDLRGLAVDVPHSSPRDRFLRQVAIARADYLAQKAKRAARRSKANAVSAGVAAVCILAATASIAGAANDLPKITLPISLQDIVDSISPSSSTIQSDPDTPSLSPVHPLAYGNVDSGGLDSHATTSVGQAGPIVGQELRQLLQALQNVPVDEQTPDPSASLAPAPETRVAPEATPAPSSTPVRQAESPHSSSVGTAQNSGAANRPEPPSMQPTAPPDEPQAGIGQDQSSSGQPGTSSGQPGSTPDQPAPSAGQPTPPPGLTASTPGQSGSAPGLSGSTPGLGGPAPGQTGSAPGLSGSTPGLSGSTPGQSGSVPSSSNSDGEGSGPPSAQGGPAGMNSAGGRQSDAASTTASGRSDSASSS